ncbi:hypothetical protein HPB51_027175 [Rhipicephalus microplus]|uniref:SCP domain-containing protein n=1 Tax=Rhipicephalus microplus TaxID=6941 RepID=A0A9J6D184_RHIMP|nr:hypothetical protein HPB51_027175 [Rhipicephalus microplus]
MAKLSVTTSLGSATFICTALSLVNCTIWVQQLPPPQNSQFPPPPPPWWNPHTRPHTPNHWFMMNRTWPFPATLNLIRPGLWSTFNGTLLQSVSPDEVVFITRFHNELRQTLALGKLGGFPPAADMLLLEYDGEVARRAQVHSQSCRFQHGCFGCGQVRGYIGQNLFLAPRGNWEQAIRTWWEEHRSTSRDIVGRFNFSPRNGHFTQRKHAEAARVHGRLAVLLMSSGHAMRVRAGLSGNVTLRLHHAELFLTRVSSDSELRLGTKPPNSEMAQTLEYILVGLPNKDAAHAKSPCLTVTVTIAYDHWLPANKHLNNINE